MSYESRHLHKCGLKTQLIDISLVTYWISLEMFYFVIGLRVGYQKIQIGGSEVYSLISFPAIIGMAQCHFFVK
ncbi:hypothetical protein SODG_004847 [Sodalis praecaptivus]|nr:hypothetical protein NVIRENTERO_03571 [Sodalis praecaptivus]